MYELDRAVGRQFEAYRQEAPTVKTAPTPSASPDHVPTPTPMPHQHINITNITNIQPVFDSRTINIEKLSVFKNPKDPLLAELLKDRSLAQLESILPLWGGSQSDIPEVQKLITPIALMLRMDDPSGTGLTSTSEAQPVSKFSMSTAFMATVEDTLVLMGAGHSFRPLKGGVDLDNFKLIFSNPSGTTQVSAVTR